MNPYQVMGVIAICTMVFAGVVTFLTMQGVHILYAFLGVYLSAVWLMLGMQRRARESYEVREDLKLRRNERRSQPNRGHAIDSQKIIQASPGVAKQLRV